MVASAYAEVSFAAALMPSKPSQSTKVTTGIEKASQKRTNLAALLAALQSSLPPVVRTTPITCPPRRASLMRALSPKSSAIRSFEPASTSLLTMQFVFSPSGSTLSYWGAVVRLLEGRYVISSLAFATASELSFAIKEAVPFFAFVCASASLPVTSRESCASSVIITKSALAAARAFVPKQVPVTTEICGTAPEILDAYFSTSPAPASSSVP